MAFWPMDQFKEQYQCSKYNFKRYFHGYTITKLININTMAATSFIVLFFLVASIYWYLPDQ